MAAIAVQAGTMRMPVAAGRRLVDRRSLAAIGLAIAAVTLLVAMLPGLARVPSIDAMPSSLVAPVTSGVGSPTSTLVGGMAPLAGLHP
jgi:hypothetical protein